MKVLVSICFWFLIRFVCFSQTGTEAFHTNKSPDCPPLPQKELSLYHKPAHPEFYIHTLMTSELISLHEEELAAQKNNGLKYAFNKLLYKLRKMDCNLGTLNGNGIFLFQTCEFMSDPSGKRNTIRDSALILTDTCPIPVLYGGLFQRDIFRVSDSVRITNWYIKQFSGDERKQLIRERSMYAKLADSLNFRIREIESSNNNWDLKDRLIDPLRNQRQLLIPLRDSLDYLLYPTLKKELAPWYKLHQFPDPSLQTVYYPFTGGVYKQINSDQDPFLQNHFRLHHGLADDSFFGKVIIPGDSVKLKGTDIFHAPVVEEDRSPWRNLKVSFVTLDSTHLMVIREDSNIGETYQFFRQNYLIYEIAE